jgi:hypothetical protein
MRRRELSVWDEGKQNNSVQECSLIIVEKDGVDRDCQGIEKLRILKGDTLDYK